MDGTQSRKQHFQKWYFVPHEGWVCSRDKITSKKTQKGVESRRKPWFLKIPCKRKLLERVLKIEISQVFKNIEKWVLRRPKKSLIESKKMCREHWIQSWNYVLQNYVFRSREWPVYFHDRNSRKFSLFWKTPLFFSVVRVLRVLEGFQFCQNSRFWGISSSDSGSGENRKR